MKEASNINGALIIDKPPGMTSHDVVSRLRRILRTKKIGHTGTLDPFATGVLVMLVGKATRLARFLDKDEKTYEAVVSFGFETDTGDRDGEDKSKVESKKEETENGKWKTENGETMSTVDGSRWQSHPSAVADGEDKSKVKSKKEKIGKGDEPILPDSGDFPSKEELSDRVTAVLSTFTGEIEQIPPMYSAKKVKGKKLYELARQGIEIEREPVTVNIKELAVLEGISSNPYSEKTETETNEIVLKVTCTAGTYIRTLAEDIGKQIGVGCHLSELRRTKAGRFSIEQAVTLEELEKLTESGLPDNISMAEIVGHLPTQTLDDDDVKRISAGIKIEARIETGAVLEVRLVNSADELIAIGQTTPDGMIQPKAVFNSGATEP